MNRNKAASNILWRLAERGGAQGVNFLVSIMLARVLAPDDYGLVALVAVFIAIMQVFVDSGLGNALIQKKDADEVDFSSVFYFNFAVCLLIYSCIYFAAPFLGGFYSDVRFIPVVRVLGLTVIISGVKNIQQAYVARHMIFKKFFFATFGGTVFSAVLGILLAIMGAGVWALVVQQLSNTLVDTIILWISVKWRPHKVFNLHRLKSLLYYGWKLLASALLETLYNELRSLIIAKVYSSADLAYYNKGNQFPSFIVGNVNSAIDSVLLPSMSSEQNDKVRLKEMVRRSIKTSSYVIWPIITGLAVCAHPIVQFLLTDKWLQCVPFMQILCVNYAFWPLHTTNLNAIKAVGRSDLFLKMELLKKVIGVVSIIASIPFGVYAIAISFTLTAPISAVINAWPNKKLFDYSIGEQIKDVFPALFCSACMAVAVYPIQLIGIVSPFVILIIQACFGISVYIGVSILLRIDSFSYIVSFVKEKLGTR